MLVKKFKKYIMVINNNNANHYKIFQGFFLLVKCKEKLEQNFSPDLADLISEI